jgi:transposase
MAQHLTNQHTHTIVVLDERRYTQRAIANTVGCSQYAVQDTIQRYRETGSVSETEGAI